MDSYFIKILAIKGSEVTAIYHLYSTQVPDLPLKKNIAFQFITDAYYCLNEFDIWCYFNEEVITPEKKAELLNHCAVKELEAYNKLLRNVDQSPEYTAIANQQILSLELLLDKNWDVADEWEKEIFNGTDYFKTTIEAPSSTLKFSVKNEQLLKHITPGLKWSTRSIWDRDE